MRLPAGRGPVSGLLVERLGSGRSLPAAVLREARRASAVTADVMADEDIQLALAVCYELHYRGFDGVDDGWEWDPGLLTVRGVLEEGLQRALMEVVPPTPAELLTGGDWAGLLRAMIDRGDGPSLSGWLLRRATVGHFREFVTHRSVYHLKEADPHTWGIPRLSGAAKAALVEIQSDEYGGGRVDRMHATLFADTMRALGLDDSYGAYWDVVPAVTLATTNVTSWLGLHRRWRGALVGHLAALEGTSTGPNRRYGNGLRRLGFGPAAAAFYDEHVEADAVHEQLAIVDLCGSVVAAEPALAGDVLFGAGCGLAVEARFAGHLLDAWQQGGSSLRRPPVEACG